MEEKKSKKQKKRKRKQEKRKRNATCWSRLRLSRADRYERAGNAQKAGAHFGRALDYGAARFGIDEKKRNLDQDSDSDYEDPRDPFIFDYDDPVWDKYSDALFRAAAAFPNRRGSFEINDARKKRDAELENLDRMCKNGDREACDKQAAFKRLLAQREALADEAEGLYMRSRKAADALREDPNERTLRLDIDDFEPNPESRKQAKQAYYKRVLDEYETDRVRRLNLKKRAVPTSFFST